MGFNKMAQDYLDKCRVIGFAEVKEGIIVSSTPTCDYRVSNVTVKPGDINEEIIEEFSLIDFHDLDKSKMVMNFKKMMSDIVGRKKYYIEENVYNFLADLDTEVDEFEIDYDYDDAEERARQEAAEEEAAEHDFERFLRIQEEM